MEQCLPSECRIRFGAHAEPVATCKSLNLHQGKSLPPWAHRTPRFVKEILKLKPGLITCYLNRLQWCASRGLLIAAEGSSCQEGGVGLVAQPLAFLLYFSRWVGQGPRESPGWSDWSSPEQCRFRFGCVWGAGRGLTLTRGHPPVGCTGGVFNAGIRVVVPPALAL